MKEGGEDVPKERANIWTIHAQVIPSAIVSAGDKVCLSGEQDDKMLHAHTRTPLLRLTVSSAEQLKFHIGNDVTTSVVGEVVSEPDEYGLVEVRLARVVDKK